MEDEQGFQPGQLDRGPLFVRELLDLLGVAAAPLEEQEAAVQAWLAANTPSPALRRDLRRFALL